MWFVQSLYPEIDGQLSKCDIIYRNYEIIGNDIEEICANEQKPFSLA